METWCTLSSAESKGKFHTTSMAVKSCGFICSLLASRQTHTHTNTETHALLRLQEFPWCSRANMLGPCFELNWMAIQLCVTQLGCSWMVKPLRVSDIVEHVVHVSDVINSGLQPHPECCFFFCFVFLQKYTSGIYFPYFRIYFVLAIFLFTIRVKTVAPNFDVNAAELSGPSVGSSLTPMSSVFHRLIR